VANLQIIRKCKTWAITVGFRTDVKIQLQCQLLSSECIGKQKGQKGAIKAKTLSLFAFIAPFALFAPNLPFAMRPDFKNAPRPQDSELDL
jgi:hypothetical protein